ncbi:MAG: hypothetical protein R6X12_10360 [bacterium]
MEDTGRFYRAGERLQPWPGAPFNLGCLAELGDVTLRPRAPAVEDAVFHRRRARRLGVVPAPPETSRKAA